MKRIIALITVMALCKNLTAQVVYIQEGATVFTAGDGNIVIHRSNLVNNSILADFSGCKLQMSGSTNNTIGGPFTTVIKQLSVNKLGSTLLLSGNLQVNALVEMQAGLLDLSGSNIVLQPEATVTGENESKRIIGSAGGEISINVNLNNPNNINPGNLGVTFTATGNIGQVNVRRGHLLQTSNGSNFGIKRYYQLDGVSGVTYSGTLRFKYFEAEMHNSTDANLVIWSGGNNGLNWVNRGFTSKSVTQNYIESTTLTQLERFTLNDPFPGLSAAIGNTREKVEIAAGKSLQIQVFPNPAMRSEKVTAKIIAAKEMMGSVFIHTVNGTVLQSVKTNINAGTNMLPLATRDLLPGTYIISIVMKNGERRSLPLIKQ